MYKKIRNIKLPIIAFILMISFFSCNEWLDLEPENQLVQQEFWKKKEDVAAVMAAMYNAYRDCSRDLWIWGELRADMLVFNGPTVGNFRQIANGEILPTNSAISWTKFYNAINLANTIMVFSEGVVPLDETFDYKTQRGYEAEALFIRSKAYFDLVRIWKEVPLVLQASNADTVSFSIAKSTEAEILSQIEKDLIRAKTIAFKDEFADIPEMYKGRANIHSINALLADVYLWGEQYQKCVETCDEIINSGKFQLQNENDWFYLYFPGNASESIFEIQYNELYENETSPISTSLIPVVGSAQVALSPIAQELFGITDIRKGSPNPLSKYQFQDLKTRLKRTSNQRDANIIYYRYADILLMKADALAELGLFNESNFYINEILQRATLPPMNIEPNIVAFRSIILEERSKEFILEGKRWFDVLRYAKRNNFQNKNYIIQMILAGADVKQRPILRSKILDPMSYYLPIPQNELDYNPKLVQNPFYDR